MGISAINACRAQEGIGPLRLPSNWSSLTPVQQGFVLIDLERVNRGLPAIIGLSGPLNTLATAGADSDNDPSFPAGGFVGGGGIWAGAPSVLASDYLWMYVDGPGGSNLDCGSAGDSGCWGHRDIILWNKPGTLVAGGGFSNQGGGDVSSAYLVLSGYSTGNLTFTWGGELRYFTSKPGLEPLTGEPAGAARRHRKTRRKHHRGKRTAPASSSSSSSGSSASGGPVITVG